jgi:hypothetical protein
MFLLKRAIQNPFITFLLGILLSFSSLYVFFYVINAPDPDYLKVDIPDWVENYRCSNNQNITVIAPKLLLTKYSRIIY